MKLSAGAKEFVRSEIKSAFADELKRAESARDAARNAAKAKVEAFESDFKSLAKEWEKSLVAIARKRKLTFREDNDFAIVVQSKYSYRGEISDYMFEETNRDGGEINPYYEAVTAVEEKISRAVSKALFEIEVHGKRDTVQEIVDSVIREIRGEK